MSFSYIVTSSCPFKSIDGAISSITFIFLFNLFICFFLFNIYVISYSPGVLVSTCPSISTSLDISLLLIKAIIPGSKYSSFNFNNISLSPLILKFISSLVLFLYKYKPIIPTIKKRYIPIPFS